MRSYAMRGAVPVLLSAQLITIAVTRQVSALNPALRIPPGVVGNAKRQKTMPIDFNRLLPNWTLKITEVSNNVFRFTAKSNSGSKSEITESDYDYGYRKCIDGAFDIESKLNNDYKFIYDTFIRLIDPNTIKDHRYDLFAFGSWYIESNSKRIILDGRDFELRIETKKGDEWISIKSFSTKHVFKYDELEMILSEYK